MVCLLAKRQHPTYIFCAFWASQTQLASACFSLCYIKKACYDIWHVPVAISDGTPLNAACVATPTPHGKKNAENMKARERHACLCRLPSKLLQLSLSARQRRRGAALRFNCETHLTPAFERRISAGAWRPLRLLSSGLFLSIYFQNVTQHENSIYICRYLLDVNIVYARYLGAYLSISSQLSHL